MKKNLTNFIYEYSSFEDILNNYIKYLRQKKDINSIQHVMKLIEYKNIRLNEDLINHIKHIVFEIESLIKKYYPTLKFKLEVRIKSLVGTEEKILRNILLGHSVDIKDFIGIRIIFFTDNTLDEILKFYKIIINIIDCIISNSCILCQAEDLVDTENFDISKFPDIIIPPKNDVYSIPGLDKYIFGFKDYIITPKDYGYQSIHVAFKNVNGNFFEVQFRNLYMHKIATCSNFSHYKYKNEKYKSVRLNIDPLKIHTKNYSVDKDSKKYIDFDGIIEPLLKLAIL